MAAVAAVAAAAANSAAAATAATTTIAAVPGVSTTGDNSYLAARCDNAFHFTVVLAEHNQREVILIKS